MTRQYITHIELYMPKDEHSVQYQTHRMHVDAGSRLPGTDCASFVAARCQLLTIGRNCWQIRQFRQLLLNESGGAMDRLKQVLVVPGCLRS